MGLWCGFFFSHFWPVHFLLFPLRLVVDIVEWDPNVRPWKPLSPTVMHAYVAKTLREQRRVCAAATLVSALSWYQPNKTKPWLDTYFHSMYSLNRSDYMCWFLALVLVGWKLVFLVNLPNNGYSKQPQRLASSLTNWGRPLSGRNEADLRLSSISWTCRQYQPSLSRWFVGGRVCHVIFSYVNICNLTHPKNTEHDDLTTSFRGESLELGTTDCMTRSCFNVLGRCNKKQ